MNCHIKDKLPVNMVFSSRPTNNGGNKSKQMQIFKSDNIETSHADPIGKVPYYLK